MDALAHFTIPVSGLHNGPHEYKFSIDGTFFQCFPESPIKDGDVAVQLLFDKQPDMYTMTFQLEGTVKTGCDRCLEEFDLPIEADEMLLVKFDEKEWEDADIIYILKEATQRVHQPRRADSQDARRRRGGLRPRNAEVPSTKRRSGRSAGKHLAHLGLFERTAK
jgi:hypothetical protein